MHTRSTRSLNLSRENNPSGYDAFRKIIAVVFEEIAKSMQMSGEYTLAKAMNMLAYLFKYDLAPTIVSMIQDAMENLKTGVKNGAIKTNTQRIH